MFNYTTALLNWSESVTQFSITVALPAVIHITGLYYINALVLKILCFYSNNSFIGTSWWIPHNLRVIINGLKNG